MDIVDVDETNFEEYKKHGLIMYWASWCGPCISPTMNAALDGLKNIPVGKLNCDEQKDIAIREQIAVVPTYVIYKDGQAKHVLPGLKKPEELQKLINSL